ncbi:hypothetical protein RUM44_006733 [Polyplax serrata]|uniref:Uncharacterized protein n=1 Tax=Polyplax serrata TaxID=468196 RepID=A0ABR1AJ57_POLSC
MCALCTKKDRKKEREKKWERKKDRQTQVLCVSSGSDVHQSKRVKEKKSESGKKCKTRSREYGEGRHNPRKSNPKKGKLVFWITCTYMYTVYNGNSCRTEKRNGGNGKGPSKLVPRGASECRQSTLSQVCR